MGSLAMLSVPSLHGMKWKTCCHVINFLGIGAGTY
jgi:hypothetical protein